MSFEHTFYRLKQARFMDIPAITLVKLVVYEHVIANLERILGERLLISSLPGKASKMPVDIARLAEQFNMRSQSRVW